jgi:membrane-associated protein
MVDLLAQGLDFIRHLDEHLQNLVAEYQTLTYLILALIIFCETGLVVTPFLPGDSLLFAAGAVAAGGGALNVWILIPILILAAILGDNVNYFFGRFLGKKVFARDYWFLKKEYITRTQAFYNKFGGRTLIMARFVPIVRTFAPFVAGVGEMTYSRFITFCIGGGFLWVSSMTLAGYFIGHIPIIKNNFEIVVLGIIGISVLPMVFELVRSRMQKN